MNFDAAFERLLGHEKGYSDHPADKGGKTMHGITERVAREHGYTGDMRDLPLGTAKSIAFLAYWGKVRASEMPVEVRFDLFDAAYNSGPAQAIEFLQRAAGVQSDGALGPKTMGAVTSIQGWRLVARFNGHRLDFLNNLANWPSFAGGWSQRIAENLIAL